MAADSDKKLLEDLKKRVEIAENNAEKFQEDYNGAILSMTNLDNPGWSLLNSGAQQEFELRQIQRVSRFLREWADTNPLLKRGIEIRASYLYSDGYEMSTEDNGGKFSSRIQAIIDDQDNQDALFSTEALFTAERDRYCSGFHGVIYDQAKRKFRVLAFNEISDFIFDPDDVTKVWFYQQTYTRQKFNPATGQLDTETVIQWIPTDRYTGPIPSNITNSGTYPVLKNTVIIDHRVNRASGNTFGMPDSFAAAPWALEYSGYLQDGRKLMASLAQWAWKLSPKTKAGGQAVGAKLRTQSGDAGRIATTDMDMQSLPKAGQVDLTDGAPFAAQVASNLGITVDLLLADTSTAAYTASDPVLQSMRFRQQSVASFLTRCLKAIGVKTPTINMGDMARDAGYRQGQTLAGAWGTGLFEPDEIRGPLADAANITLLHASAPSGVQIPNNENDIVGEKAAELQAAKNGIAAVAAAQTAQTQNPDGSNSQANGQGHDATGVGKVSAGDNALRDAAGKSSIANSKPSTGR